MLTGPASNSSRPNAVMPIVRTWVAVSVGLFVASLGVGYAVTRAPDIVAFLATHEAFWVQAAIMYALAGTTVSLLVHGKKRHGDLLAYGTGVIVTAVACVVVAIAFFSATQIDVLDSYQSVVHFFLSLVAALQLVVAMFCFIHLPCRDAWDSD